MPNRIIKESICVSESIAELNWFEEVLFYRLIVACDDFGRFDGRVAVIKNRLFPLKDTLTAKAVKDGINRLASVGLVTLYEVEGRPYLHLPTWNDHQNVRAKRSKYPDPEISSSASVGVRNADEYKCNQLPANVPVIQSESVSESNTENARVGAKTPRHQYGRYKNVMLTDEDYEKLQCEFPHDYSDRIERLSEYIASSGKSYKNHLATIRNWASRDKQSNSGGRRGGNIFMDIGREEGLF